MKTVNPWAVCHAQLGKKKTKKFERCVMKVKAKHGLKEAVEYIKKFLEDIATTQTVPVEEQRGPQGRISQQRRGGGGGGWGGGDADMTDRERKRQSSEQGGPAGRRSTSRPRNWKTLTIAQKKAFRAGDKRWQQAGETEKAPGDFYMHVSDSIEHEGYYIAEITSAYIEKAAAADRKRALKKWDANREGPDYGVAKEPWTAYGQGATDADLESETTAATKRGEKLKRVNIGRQKRRAEKRAAENASTKYEGPSIAEITQEYIRRARDADIGRHKKKYDTLKSISKGRSSTRGYAAGRFVTKQDATWKKSKKLLAINKRRTAERETAKTK